VLLRRDKWLCTLVGLLDGVNFKHECAVEGCCQACATVCQGGGVMLLDHLVPPERLATDLQVSLGCH
jgi:hypothetical protein